MGYAQQDEDWDLFTRSRHMDLAMASFEWVQKGIEAVGGKR